MKKRENNIKLVFVGDIKAIKQQIKQAMKNLCDTAVVPVSTLMSPTGQKKAYVQLAPDHEALHAANNWEPLNSPAG